MSRPVRVSVESDAPSLASAAARLLREAGMTVTERGTVACVLATGAVPVRLARVAEVVAARPGAIVVATLPAAAAGGVLRRVLRAGASGIVPDEELDAVLAPTVHAVLAGQIVVPSTLRRQLAPEALSHREKQVMGLVATGHTNRQIAGELYLSESTIKSHLSSAFTKLGARSRAEAAALVLDPETGYGLAIVGDAARAAA